MNFFPKASGALLNSHHPGQAGAVDFQRSISRPRLAGSRVLVVEDEFIIALEIQTALEEAGATVIGPAFTVSKAVEFALHENVSAATLDLRLGRESVRHVAMLLAERHIPFIFYTGQPANDPVRCAWPNAPALSKPASSVELVNAVAQIIRTQH